MAVNDVSIFAMLRTKMNWHGARQQVLAQNVANADTPDYLSRDLKSVDFRDEIRRELDQPLQTRVTNAAHIAAAGSANASGFRAGSTDLFEMTPEGNAVVLEDEMMKVTANQIDYQAASSLYSKSLGFIKTALGRR